VERPDAPRARLPALSGSALGLCRALPAGALALAASAGACRTAAPRAPARADSAPRAAPVDSGPPARRAAVDPQTAVRFEVVAVDDTTFAFRAANAPWLRPRTIGSVVDPRRRDVLVARFVLLAVAGDTATALVTGQTTRVTTDHVALVPRPQSAAPPPSAVISRVEKQRFWTGAAVGALFGLIAGTLLRL
jgi:hypothetical protein